MKHVKVYEEHNLIRDLGELGFHDRVVLDFRYENVGNRWHKFFKLTTNPEEDRIDSLRLSNILYGIEDDTKWEIIPEDKSGKAIVSMWQDEIRRIFAKHLKNSVLGGRSYTQITSYLTDAFQEIMEKHFGVPERIKVSLYIDGDKKGEEERRIDSAIDKFRKRSV